MSRLSQKFLSARRNSSLVVLEGFHPVKHALAFGYSVEIYTCAKNKLIQTAHRLAPALSPSFEEAIEISPAKFAALSPNYIKTRVIGLASKPNYSFEQIHQNSGRVLALENIRNLKNLGAIVRTAAARGVAGILYSGTLDCWNPNCLVVSRGLHLGVPIVAVKEMAVTLSTFTHRTKIGLDGDGKILEKGSIPENALLCFGSERSGLSAQSKSKLTALVRIPMQPEVSSLNLASAVAITLYQ